MSVSPEAPDCQGLDKPGVEQRADAEHPHMLDVDIVISSLATDAHVGVSAYTKLSEVKRTRRSLIDPDGKFRRFQTLASGMSG